MNRPAMLTVAAGTIDGTRSSPPRATRWACSTRWKTSASRATNPLHFAPVSRTSGGEAGAVLGELADLNVAGDVDRPSRQIDLPAHYTIDLKSALVSRL